MKTLRESGLALEARCSGDRDRKSWENVQQSRTFPLKFSLILLLICAWMWAYTGVFSCMHVLLP